MFVSFIYVFLLEMITCHIIPFCVIPNIGSALSGIFTCKNGNTFYKDLKKPVFTPPYWSFPVVWTGLYTTMGYASYLVWRDGNGFYGKSQIPLILYGSQLLLNWAWSPIFFAFQKLGLACIEIMLLWSNIVVCIAAFRNINQTAAYLMIPYLAWTSFASALCFYIWKENKPSLKERDESKSE